MMKNELQPMHCVGSLLNEQFEQEESHVPLINAHVAIAHLPCPVKAKLTVSVVMLRSATLKITENRWSICVLEHRISESAVFYPLRRPSESW